MERGPVVSELGRRWLSGELSVDEYDRQVRRRAWERAVARTRLRFRLNGQPTAGGRAAAVRSARG